MTPTIKANLSNTYHRDGTVSYWDLYRQMWTRREVSRIPDRVLATMSQPERDIIDSSESYPYEQQCDAWERDEAEKYWAEREPDA